MTATLLALSFTLPIMQAHGCAAGPHALRSDSLSWAVYARVQSPTWLGMSAAMLALPAVWAAYWPRVRAEAEPVRVASGKRSVDIHAVECRICFVSGTTQTPGGSK